MRARRRGGAGGPRAVGEAAAVAALARCFAGGERGGEVELGVGDDAAVLAPRGRRLVWTVDAQVEHVHFERGWLSLSGLGARALHAAASDLAAMGARPVAALSAVVLPRGLGAAELTRVARGQARAARALGCPVVGGNVARGGELSITTTVLGEAKRPLRRDTARPGDELWLVGDVGLARAGLLSLQGGNAPPGAERPGAAPPGAARALAACRRALLAPRARIEDGLALVGRATAALDLSDGLAADGARLGAASRARVVVEAEALARALPAALGRAATVLGVPALELALTGGEDYALLCTGPARRRPSFARRIGRIEAGHGLFVEHPGGAWQAPAGGFDHLTCTAPASPRRGGRP